MTSTQTSTTISTVDEKEKVITLSGQKNDVVTASKEPIDLELESQSRPSERELDIDGGWKGWSTVAGAWLVQFCAVGAVAAFGVYQSFYTLNYLTSTPTSTISWVGSIQLFLELTSGPVGGFLLDMGYFRSILGSGALLFVFGFFMLSLAQPNAFYQVLLAQGFAMGLGVGIMYIPTTSMVSGHFRKWRGLAIGIASTGGSLGGVVFTIMLNYLLNSRAGFAWATRAAAFISLFCLSLAFILIRRPASSKPREPSATPAVPSPSRSSFLHLFRDPAYILALLGGACICLGLWTPMFFLQLYAELHGINQGLAFYSLAILNLSSSFGRTVPNMLADRFGLYRVYIPVIVISGALCFGLLACGTTAGLVVIAIFYGFFSGGNISLFFPLIASLGSDPADIGRRLGFSGFPLGVAMLVGPPISSALLRGSSDWTSCLAFAAVVQIVGAVLIALCGLLVRNEKRQWSWV